MPILQWGIKTASPIPSFLLGWDTDQKALPSIPKDMDTQWPLSSLHFSWAILSSPFPLPSPKVTSLPSPLQPTAAASSLDPVPLHLHPPHSSQTIFPKCKSCHVTLLSKAFRWVPRVKFRVFHVPVAAYSSCLVSRNPFSVILHVMLHQHHAARPCNPLHLAIPWPSWKLKHNAVSATHCPEHLSQKADHLLLPWFDVL